MTIKIGAPSYINALPFFYPLLTKKIPFNGELIFDAPSKINELLEKGKIDVGLVSSTRYLDNEEKYNIITNLGIAAFHEVMSVILFAKPDLVAIKTPKIAVTSASNASARLLKVICHSFL